MGWDFFRPSREKTADIIRYEVLYDGTSDYWEVVDLAIVRNVAYVAQRLKKVYERPGDLDNSPYRAGDVIGLVILIRRERDSQFPFGTNEMDESSGPFYYDCPERILSQLTEPRTDSARAWRQACRDRRLGRKSMPRPGQMIEFAQPLAFTTFTESRFVAESYGKSGKGRVYRPFSRNVRCRIPNIMERDFRILSASDVAKAS